jgi:hypothetical protein
MLTIKNQKLTIIIRASGKMIRIYFSEEIEAKNKKIKLALPKLKVSF